jgi:hypothetical protein
MRFLDLELERASAGRGRQLDRGPYQLCSD